MEKSQSSGIGFSGLLLVAFIVLKLCNVITWSWWWVISPLWIRQVTKNVKQATQKRIDGHRQELERLVKEADPLNNLQ